MVNVLIKQKSVFRLLDRKLAKMLQLIFDFGQFYFYAL